MRAFVFGMAFLLYGSASLGEAKPFEEQSSAELKDVIAADPTNLSAYYHLARSYLGLHQAPLKTETESLNEQLEASSAFYEDALLRIEDGEERAAIIQLINAIKVNETNVSAYILLAQTYQDIRVPKGATYYLREALNYGADPSVVLVPLGETLLAQEKYEEVLAELSLAGLPRNLKARVRVLHGKAYIGLQEFDKATRVLNEAIMGDASIIGAPIELARLDMMRGDRVVAVGRLDAIESMGVFRPDYWLIRGELARTGGNYETAINLYQKAINLEDDHLLALQATASLNLDLGKLAEARPFITTIRALYPADLRGMLLALMLATREGDVDARQQTLAAADGVILTIDFLKLQDDPYNLVLVGSIHHLAGRMNEAAAILSRYLEFAPSDLGALRLLVTAELRLRKPEMAASILDQARRYHEDNVVWLLLYGEVRIQQKRYADALAYFDRVIEKNPEDQQTRLRRVTLNATMGNHEKALEELESLRVDDADPLIGITQANILLALGRFERVLVLVNELMESGGKNATLLNIEGNAHLGLGALKKARNSFSYALLDDPEAIAATFNIATLDLKEGNVEAAKRRFLDILKKNKTHTLSMIQLSNIAQREGNSREAIRYLQNAMRIRSDIENSLRLADLLIADERGQEAREVLTDLRLEYPEDISVIAAEARWSLLDNNPDRAKMLYVAMRHQAVENDSAAELVIVARYQQAIGEYENAALTLDAAQNIDKNNLSVLVTRAELNLKQDDFQQALLIAEHIIEQAPEEAIGYRLKGDSLSLQEQGTKALTAYKAGVEKTGGSITLILRYYGALRESEGQAIAVEFLEGWVVETRTGDFTMLRALAAGHADLGNTAKAIKMNELLLANRSDDATLLNNLAMLYLKTGDDRAQSFAEKAFDLEPQNYAFMDTLGWVLTNNGEITLGIAMLRNAMTRSADILEIRYHYAVALHKNGQSKNALKELRTLLFDGRTFDGMDEARTLYQELLENS